MYNMINLSLVVGYVRYFFKARYAKGYGVHSPFVFDLIREVIYDKSKYYHFETIKKIRRRLGADKRIVKVEDFGTGSNVNTSLNRTVRSLARHGAIPSKYGELLFKLMVRFNPSNVIEIGTSIGISSLYLALSSSNSHIHTIDGCHNSVKIAEELYGNHCIKNVMMHVGEFDSILPNLLSELDSVDFVFFDGNHCKDATWNYFNLCLEKTNNETIFVFDDIYWSQEMQEVWSLICKHPKVTVSLDLFRIGVVFFRKECSKQHFTVRY